MVEYAPIAVYHTWVNHAIRPFLRLIALMWLALGISVPMAAWTVHDAAHGTAQVDVDDHHHHEDDGRISVHEHDDKETPDGGHDHMPSILLGAVTLSDAGVPVAAPIAGRQTFTIPPSRGIERYPSSGLRRPPRLG